jgi:hypothetical protein
MINSKGWLRLQRRGEGVQDQFVTTNLDTLATALYVKTDDWLKESPQLAPSRPAIGITPRLSDAELVTLAVMQALLGFASEARWLRHARARMRHLLQQAAACCRADDPALHPPPGRRYQRMD